jgi:hypothetical protein
MPTTLRAGQIFYRVIIYKNSFKQTNMKKGLDISFVHYGIRKEDLELIETLCNEHQLDADWIRDDILKVYHEKRIQDGDFEGKGIEKLIEKALLKVK